MCGRKKLNIILNLTYSNCLETNCARQITHVCALGLCICSNIIKHILGIFIQCRNHTVYNR